MQIYTEHVYFFFLIVRGANEWFPYPSEVSTPLDAVGAFFTYTHKCHENLDFLFRYLLRYITIHVIVRIEF